MELSALIFILISILRRLTINEYIIIFILNKHQLLWIYVPHLFKRPFYDIVKDKIHIHRKLPIMGQTFHVQIDLDHMGGR